MSCKHHEFREFRNHWDPKTGRLYQELMCDKCGYVSVAWTLPSSDEKNISKENTNN